MWRTYKPSTSHNVVNPNAHTDDISYEQTFNQLGLNTTVILHIFSSLNRNYIYTKRQRLSIFPMLLCFILNLITNPSFFRVLVNVVKYKLDHMRRRIEMDERDSTNRASFRCPNCRSTFTDLEANQLFDPMTGKCWGEKIRLKKLGHIFGADDGKDETWWTWWWAKRLVYYNMFLYDIMSQMIVCW